MYLVHQTKPFQVFFKDYYMYTMKQYRKHYFHKIILSKQNVEDIRLINLLAGELMSSRNYTKRLLLKFHMEIQSKHFGQGQNLSIEENLIMFCPVGEEGVITDFYSFLSDKKKAVCCYYG